MTVKDEKSLYRNLQGSFNWFSFYRVLGLYILLFEMHKDPNCSLAESPFGSAKVNTTLNSGCCTSQTTALNVHHPGRLHLGAGRVLTTKRASDSKNPVTRRRLSSKLDSGKYSRYRQMQACYYIIFNWFPV